MKKKKNLIFKLGETLTIFDNKKGVVLRYGTKEIKKGYKKLRKLISV